MSPTVANPEAGENEDLILNLNEPDPPSDGKGKPNGDGAGDKPVVAKPPPVPGPTSPQTGLADLEKQIETERAARAEADERARRMQGERDQARVQAQEAERRGITTYELNVQNQIDAATEKMDALADQHAAAMNDGDFTKAAEIQKQSNRLGGQLAIFERDKAVLADQRERAKQRQPAQVQEPSDPRERVIAGRTERTQMFLRKHPDLMRSDGTFKRAAIDAHESALDAGFPPDTDAYFDHIEKTVAGNGQQIETPVRAASLGAPTTAAPVARGGAPGGGGGDSGEFRMTPKMRRLAAEQGVPEKEWAINYRRLLKEGRMTPITD